MTKTKKVHWPPQQQKPPDINMLSQQQKQKKIHQFQLFLDLSASREGTWFQKGFLEATTVPLLHWEVGWKEEEEGLGMGKWWNGIDGWAGCYRKEVLAQTADLFLPVVLYTKFKGLSPPFLHFIFSREYSGIPYPPPLYIHFPSLSFFPSSRQRLASKMEEKMLHLKYAFLSSLSVPKADWRFPKKKMCKNSADRKSKYYMESFSFFSGNGNVKISCLLPRSCMPFRKQNLNNLENIRGLALLYRDAL